MALEEQARPATEIIYMLSFCIVSICWECGSVQLTDNLCIRTHKQNDVFSDVVAIHNRRVSVQRSCLT